MRPAARRGDHRERERGDREQLPEPRARVLRVGQPGRVEHEPLATEQRRELQRHEHREEGDERPQRDLRLELSEGDSRRPRSRIGRLQASVQQRSAGGDDEHEHEDPADGRVDARTARDGVLEQLRERRVGAHQQRDEDAQQDGRERHAARGRTGLAHGYAACGDPLLRARNRRAAAPRRRRAPLRAGPSAGRRSWPARRAPRRRSARAPRPRSRRAARAPAPARRPAPTRRGSSDPVRWAPRSADRPAGSPAGEGRGRRSRRARAQRARRPARAAARPAPPTRAARARVPHARSTPGRGARGGRARPVAPAVRPAPRPPNAGVTDRSGGG